MKGRHVIVLKWILLVCCLADMSLAQQPPAGGPGKTTVLVCYPGGSVRTQDAKSAMDSMLRVLEETGEWSAGTLTGQFATEIKECEGFLSEQKPQFAITTLGTFLAFREKLTLIPLVQPRIQGSSSDIYRILVRQGSFKSLEELKGKTLGGPLVNEPTFLKRIILKGKFDPSSFFELKSSQRVLRSLRSVAMGTLDAVIINSQQYGALDSLPFADQLQVIFTSAEVPLVGAMANGQNTTEEERKRFSRSLSMLCTHPEGSQICELFGLETFVPASMKAFENVIELWDSSR